VRAAALPDVDAAIVLGAAVLADGIPSPSLQRRTLHAVDLFKKGKARFLIFTGGIGKYPPSEAQVMKRIATAHGVPDSRMVLEETATNTLESAEACAAILAARDWLGTAIVVTDRYHILRTILAFRSAGVRAIGSAPTGGRGDTALWRWWYLHLRETLALPWYLLRVWQRRGSESRR
jgi:uncharacterized SAM-binding protein YcdF (DUF218 family)